MGVLESVVAKVVSFHPSTTARVMIRLLFCFWEVPVFALGNQAGFFYGG